MVLSCLPSVEEDIYLPKVAFAQKNGAAAVVLYSDPADYVDLTNVTATEAGTFPNSPFLPPSGVQEGCVMMDEGDKLTPELPSLGESVI